jgi:protein arginine N-methyltransferase 1
VSAEVDPSGFTETNHPALIYQDMLADGTRMRRYREAIEAVVRPGDVVADLGTGTGVLAMMAAQAGAARVYAVENRPRVAWLAERVVRANGLAERVRVVEADAREAQLDEPVDLIVNELIGDFGTDEFIHECVAAFADRNLKPGGRVLPERLRTFLVPAQYGDEFRGVWRDDFHGLDLRCAIDFPCRPEAVLYPLRQRPRELAAPTLVEDLAYPGEGHARAERFELAFEVERVGTLQGFVGYFEAELAPGSELATYPCYPGCHWNNWHWPVSPPHQVAPGQRIAATLHAPAGTMAQVWSLDWTLA